MMYASWEILSWSTLNCMKKRPRRFYRRERTKISDWISGSTLTTQLSFLQSRFSTLTSQTSRLSLPNSSSFTAQLPILILLSRLMSSANQWCICWKINNFDYFTEFAFSSSRTLLCSESLVASIHPYCREVQSRDGWMTFQICTLGPLFLHPSRDPLESWCDLI